MSRPSSSTSSSDGAREGPLRAAIHAVAWIVVGLALLDVAINFVFAYPRDPRVLPSKMQTYFEYGRSTDAQLARMTRRDRSKTAPITLAGWYDPLPVQEMPGPPGSLTITFYGMSHAGRLAEALARVSKSYTPRFVSAPGATTNWAYGAFLRDHGGGKSRAVVLAFMSANLGMITTMSPMTWNIGFPMPYTGDRFYLADGKLAVAHPPYTSFDGYVNTFENPQKWEAACKAFAQYDTMYSPFMREAIFLDHSALFRLVRRAYGQHLERRERSRVLDQNGFESDTEQIEVAREIVRDFAGKARAEGMIPVIYLVNNLGYSDFLYQALRPALEASKVPYLSSHDVVSPNDPRGYLPDSHFTSAVDDRLARALIEVLKKAK